LRPRLCHIGVVQLPFQPPRRRHGPLAARFDVHALLQAPRVARGRGASGWFLVDRKSTRLNSSHVKISYAVFCLKKKKTKKVIQQEQTNKYNKSKYDPNSKTPPP